MVVVQSDHASSMVNTRIVAPLVHHDDFEAIITQLNPMILFEGRSYAVLAQSLATLTRSELGPPVGSLDKYYETISRALDVALTGF